MAQDGPPSPKKVRLAEGLNEDQDGAAGLGEVEDEAALERIAGPSDHVLRAARLANAIFRQPGRGCMLAWSVDNLIAIARSRRITLVHVRSPARLCHISIDEKPNRLEFSPDGKALLATFPESGTVSIWAMDGNTLNRWSLQGQWRQMEGKALHACWMGQGRRRVLPSMKRIPTRGPQLYASRSGYVAALVLTDAGQLTIIEGRAHAPTSFRIYQHKIPLAAHLRLQHAQIGFVADEPVALIAFTTRLSSKAHLPNAYGANAALGMFFDEDDGLDAATAKALPSDGQDCIDIVEVRIDAFPASDNLVITSRMMPPVFLAAFDGPVTPTRDDLHQLLWIDVVSESAREAIPMQLFAAFHTKGISTLRTWLIKREDTGALSEAFNKLEAAKVKSASGDEEEWVVQDPTDGTFEAEYLYHFTASPWAERRLICHSRLPPSSARLDDVPKSKCGFRVFDLDTMAVHPFTVIRAGQADDSACAVVLSPHATMMAGIQFGKLFISSTDNMLKDEINDAAVFVAAILEGQDLSDLKLTEGTSWDAVASLLHIDKRPNLGHALQLTSLQARLSKLGDANALTARTLLELMTSFRLLVSAQANDGDAFRLTSCWTVVSQMKWTLRLLELTARQAHLFQSKDSASSPAATTPPSDESLKGHTDEPFEQYRAEDEPDMLSLLSFEVPRQVLNKNLTKLVAFHNWLNGLLTDAATTTNGTRGSEFKTVATKIFRSDQSNGPEQIAKMAGMLRLSQVQTQEALLSSAIDLSQAGRWLKAFKVMQTTETTVKEEAQEDQPASTSSPWFLTPTASLIQKRQVAQSLLASGTVRSMLDLFCPPAEWDAPLYQGDTDWVSAGKASLRPTVATQDILTKADLPNGEPMRRQCVTCHGQTQADISEGIRCVCGASTWWATHKPLEN